MTSRRSSIPVPGCRGASRCPSGRRRSLPPADLGAPGRHEPGGHPSAGIFPYPSLPHPKHANGGQVFPQMQIDMFPRLERFDVEFDLPEAFLPEFPAGDLPAKPPRAGRRLARGGRLHQQLPPAVQGSGHARCSSTGCGCCVTPFPQEEFNPTDDRKTAAPEPGRDLPRLPRQRPHHRAVPPEPRQAARRSGASGSTRSACAECSTSRSTARSGACDRSRTSPSSSSAPRTSTATRSTP